ALAPDADAAQHGVARERQEHVLDAQILVLQRPHLVLGRGADLRPALGRVSPGWTGCRPGDLGLSGQLPLDGLLDRARRGARRDDRPQPPICSARWAVTASRSRTKTL